VIVSGECSGGPMSTVRRSAARWCIRQGSDAPAALGRYRSRCVTTGTAIVRIL
jgi:hypothetical protein